MVVALILFRKQFTRTLFHWIKKKHLKSQAKATRFSQTPYICQILPMTVKWDYLIANTNKHFLADAIFMWTGPPPAWNQTDSNTDNIQTAVMRVLNGSKNVHLRWNYNLLDGQSIRFTVFRIYYGIKQRNVIGHVMSGNVKVSDQNNYRDQFSINSTNEFATVTIKTVTERENTTFQCQITAGMQEWTYNIRLGVTGINRFSRLLLIN